ncbi:MAG: NHLP family bacteriocin export ABC transporter peptidase/permease/ATPase subunit [Atopobiaceae bacterium]|jgi:NHLM bacteriocin system ABC transporter peptidase/ATP-binding protein|nr:NHLP family bacteriocin export ABC transporter peptidase/permease/ATPase subunit [Atopobiaceae bacterium]
MPRAHSKPQTGGVAKVPVVMQMESLECGAACLAMVLAYYGRWVPLAQLREDSGVSRDGAKASNVLTAAEKYGMVAKGYRYGIENLKKRASYPCIIHWNFNHFVVLDGFRGNRAYLNDPGIGAYSVPMDEFDVSYTGICLLFSPGERFEPAGRQTSILSFARMRLKGSASVVAFVILTTVLVSVAGLVDPVILFVFVDEVLSGRNPDWLGPLCLIAGTIATLTLVTHWVKAAYTEKINGKFAVMSNAEFFWHLMRLPMEFFSQRMSGDISTTQESNETIANTFIQTFGPLVLNAILMLLYLAVMLRYNIMLTALAVTSAAINLLVSQRMAKEKVNITRGQVQAQGKLYGTTLAGIEMVETIKASGAENGFFERWAGYQAKVIGGTQRFTKLENGLGIVPELVSSMANAVVLVLGVFLVLRGEFSIGLILAFQGLLLGFMTPANSIIQTTQKIQEMRTNMERVQDVMEYPVDVAFETSDDADEAAEGSKLSGDVILENVTFGYSRLEPPLIKNFNLHICPGQKVAFVGASGCGKSTLTKLISGLYQPWSGQVLFDGKTPAQIDRGTFTGSVAVVEQDIALFEDTIADNIRMWNKSIEDFDVVLAARDAQIHDDIMAREGGYDYRISEGGRDLSGGQRQRLEIARVLSQDPTVIVMDEATSALDSKTECDVVSTIHERGITEIVIAHRLSTIRDCDEIIVMDHGTVVERGTHEELYAKGGLYTTLISSE